MFFGVHTPIVLCHQTTASQAAQPEQSCRRAAEQKASEQNLPFFCSAALLLYKKSAPPGCLQDEAAGQGKWADSTFRTIAKPPSCVASFADAL